MSCDPGNRSFSRLFPVLLGLSFGCSQSADQSPDGRGFSSSEQVGNTGGRLDEPDNSVTDNHMPGNTVGDPNAAQPQNSQVGSIGSRQCEQDEECLSLLNLPLLNGPRGDVELLEARCEHANDSVLPGCQCKYRVTPPEQSERQASEPSFFIGFGATVYDFVNSRTNQCLLTGRRQNCLYCSQEFAGCQTEVSNSCDDACAVLTERVSESFGLTLEASARRAACNDSYTCEYILELDGACYAEPPEGRWLPPLDCSLSDTELLETGGLSASDPCSDQANIAPVTCESAESCPAGLGCSMGVCASCQADSHCFAGESCTMGVCLLEQNTTCRNVEDCPGQATCRLTGIDANSARGNATTRSFCQEPVCWEQYFDEQDNPIMTSSEDCVTQ